MEALILALICAIVVDYGRRTTYNLRMKRKYRNAPLDGNPKLTQLPPNASTQQFLPSFPGIFSSHNSVPMLTALPKNKRFQLGIDIEAELRKAEQIEETARKSIAPLTDYIKTLPTPKDLFKCINCKGLGRLECALENHVINSRSGLGFPQYKDHTYEYRSAIGQWVQKWVCPDCNGKGKRTKLKFCLMDYD